MSGKKYRQLTAGDRMYIEEGLGMSRSLKSIADGLNVNRSTVAREIKRNSVRRSPRFLAIDTQNICIKKDVCKITGLCENGCLVDCRKCRQSLCNKMCPEFRPRLCPYLAKPPYVCNDCNKRHCMGCGCEYSFYDGQLAHELASQRKVQTRIGVDISKEELGLIAKIVKPYLRKGFSPKAIWIAEKENLPMSERTFYRYVEQGVFEDILNINLPKKVKYKVRKRKNESAVIRGELEGHMYADFIQLPIEDQMSAVEMDCVVSARGCNAAILTLLFRRYGFQLMIYLKEKDQKHVSGALDMIEQIIGTNKFRRTFGTIITDRGSEFLDWNAIEKSKTGRKSRCKVYYCDPMKSGQKGRCERNHVELRKIIPKGTSFAHLDAWKLSIVCSHVNSYPRASLGGTTPYKLAKNALPEELLEHLGIVEIPLNEVNMKPGLIEL